MALSPDEMKVLETIEADLRTEDPALAAALSATPPQSLVAAPFPLSVRHVLHLLVVLVSLVLISALFAQQLGVLELGILTCAAVVPWLVGTAWSAKSRRRATSAADQRTTTVDQDEPGSSARVKPTLVTPGALQLTVALVLVLVLLPLIPPAWHVSAALVLTLVVLPWLVVCGMERVKRRSTSA